MADDREAIEKITEDNIEQMIALLKERTDLTNPTSTPQLLCLLKRISRIDRGRINAKIRDFFDYLGTVPTGGLGHLINWGIARCLVVGGRYEEAVERLERFSEKEKIGKNVEVDDGTIRILGTIPTASSINKLEKYCASEQTNDGVKEFARRIIDRLSQKTINNSNVTKRQSRQRSKREGQHDLRSISLLLACIVSVAIGLFTGDQKPTRRFFADLGFGYRLAWAKLFERAPPWLKPKLWIFLPITLILALFIPVARGVEDGQPRWRVKDAILEKVRARYTSEQVARIEQSILIHEQTRPTKSSIRNEFAAVYAQYRDATADGKWWLASNIIVEGITQRPVAVP